MFGTIVSVVGGGIMGLLVGTTLIVENGRCTIEWKMVLMDSLKWGLIGGGFGSMVSRRQIYIYGTDGGPAGLVAWGYGAVEPIFDGEEGCIAGREEGRTRDIWGGDTDEQPGECTVERGLCWDCWVVGRVMAESDDVMCVDSQNRPDLDMKKT